MVLITKKLFVRLGISALGLAALAGCELAPLPQATPTSNVEELPSPTPSVTATLTVTPAPALVSPMPTETAGPPSETPTDTPTPDPYATYIVQPGDTMNYIIQLPPFNYRTDFVVNEIMRLNPFISNPNNLPAGASILIPLPTPTPTPENFALTASAQPNVSQVSLPGNAQIIQVQVEEGQTIIGIAENNSTTLPIIATLNPQISFFGCDFSNPSGGPGCNVSLSVGDMVNVPALTPTPTLSPTISGSETVTPTPTFSAPMLIFPPQDGIAQPRTFQLQWVSVGVLQDNQVYLVEIQDETSGADTYRDITTSTSYELPESLVPSDGQTHTIHWRVSVTAPNAQGVYSFIGAQGDWRTFYWQSR
ncbi:MAG: LysM peptidoglycan-binding domain-containing protein [Anaerolineae bacterium]|nr:LysM peptidoglycan-binding domain-containing protein [Anaerolineae bacterium]